MATTVASIALQLLLLGTAVHLKGVFGLDLHCAHTYRAIGHTKGKALPADLAKVFKEIWARPQIGNEDKLEEKCYDKTIKGCATGRCIGADDGDLFRINGCHNAKNKCSDEFMKACTDKGGRWKCELCNTDKCNSKANFIDLVKGKPTTTTPEPVTNATSSAITAMPTTHIGISAKLVVAAIVNTVLLMMVAHRAALF
ncbi:hypothetical protein niasHS_013835 [Heterodera schachtii]|uniref:Uncharacterized protein n=1 Tax=Heterodera schachtii TaxID=97005 RepID=A0ABD2J3C8_HETSC